MATSSHQIMKLRKNHAEISTRQSCPVLPSPALQPKQRLTLTDTESRGIVSSRLQFGEMLSANSEQCQQFLENAILVGGWAEPL